MSCLSFSATIEINGVNPYVLVSAGRAAQLRRGWRRPMPVRYRVNGGPTAWPINLMSVGDGSFYLYLHGEARKESDTRVGDRVTVEVELDGDYQGGPAAAPAWFTAALAASPRARAAWRALIPSRQKELLRYLTRLKSPEARARNLQRAIAVLSGSKERFLGRQWGD